MLFQFLGLHAELDPRNCAHYGQLVFDILKAAADAHGSRNTGCSRIQFSKRRATCDEDTQDSARHFVTAVAAQVSEWLRAETVEEADAALLRFANDYATGNESVMRLSS